MTCDPRRHRAADRLAGHGKGYDHDDVITVRMPEGTYRWYRYVDGEWEEESSRSTSAGSSYSYPTAPLRRPLTQRSA
ncbi:MAG: hypothetical protein GEU97_01155 [Actinophytocola sp.]|nr:hypothetical protein [Actinophytocola sp.]